MSIQYRAQVALFVLSLLSAQVSSGEQELQAQIDQLHAMLISVNSELRSVTQELDLLKRGVQTQSLD